MLNLKNSGGIFDLANRTNRVSELEDELNNPDVWKNQEKADNFSRELKSLRLVIGPYHDVEGQYKAIKELLELEESMSWALLVTLFRSLR